jgi:hypothetical protein
MDDLLRRMADDEFDFIAVGPTLISNPSWPINCAMEPTVSVRSTQTI